MLQDSLAFRCFLLCLLAPLLAAASVSDELPLSIQGILPSLAATAESGPKRSECGIGALMPWADKLYMVSYLSVPNAGSGTALYAIYPNLTMEVVQHHNSTYANRLIHPQSDQAIIGAWAIAANGSVRAFKDLLTVRVGGMAVHLTDPDHKVYMLGMDGPLWECDVYQMNCTQLFDLVKELDIPASQGEQPHFKAAHSVDGVLYVASNTFEQADFVGDQHGGRFASWKGPNTSWQILERTAFVEVTGRFNFGRVVYALGWDKRSAILKVLDNGDGGEPSYNKTWQTYRLPKASHAYDHLWQTEWPRIREVETERYLMDMHGMMYELSPLGWAGATWGLRPVCQHLRMIPDFASFRGFFVVGGNQVSTIFDNNLATGQSQSGLYFGKTDDLWSWGKPKGWGAVWRYDNVTAGVASDPFLMTGFEHKTLHLRVYDLPKDVSTVTISLQVDFTGMAGHLNQPWDNMQDFTFNKPSYQYFVFPTGFSAHWVRLVTDHSCLVTAEFHYS